MKKLTFLLLSLIGMIFGNAQIATNIYWVQFTDKNDSPYSISNPEAYLSQRALERRLRLGIEIDEYDIPVNPQYLQAVTECGAKILNPSKWLNGTSVYVTSQSVIAAINALDFVEVVRNCENNQEAQEMKERWLEREMRASEVVRSGKGYYGGGDLQIKQLNGDVLHYNGFDGAGVVVAVLDGGFVGADTHPCFDNMREEGRLLGTRDFVYGSTSVYSQSTHGTSCLSTMAAYVPNTFVGTAPKASYYLLHTEDGGSENIVEEYNWVSGAEYADSLGVDVCSTSLGYINFDMSQWNHSQSHFDGKTAPMTIGAEIAVSRGMICLNSAGNEGDGSGCTLGIPADAEHVITVGAVDGNGDRAWFSSVGPTADGRIKPDVMAMGQDSYVASIDGYYNGSGTSFSTPILAGVVTCLRQAFPEASVQEICDIIRRGGNNFNNPDKYYGYGIPDFEKILEIFNIGEFTTDENSIISVFPNPTKGNVNIIFESNEAVVNVYDMTGCHIYSFSFNGRNKSELERVINGLSSGVYQIVATSKGKRQVKLLAVSY